jgi:hypothetical protein
MNNQRCHRDLPAQPVESRFQGDLAPRRLVVRVCELISEITFQMQIDFYDREASLSFYKAASLA